MALSSRPAADDLQFLRQRVALFGMFSGGSCLFFWVFRLVSGSLDNGIGAADSLTHFSSSLILLATWPLLTFTTPSRLFIRTVEALALLASCALLIGMGTQLSNVFARPEQTMLLALTIIFISRAVYVPSSGTRTALLAIGVGAMLLVAVYYIYLSSDLEPYRAYYPEFRVTHQRVANALTTNTGVWWLLSTGLAFATSRVIYGLRKDANAVRQLGQYRLHHKIGEGGMGIVYEAHHAMLRRSTAIKLLPPDHAGEAAIKRFEREVKLTARLRHPNTVTVYDYGRTPNGIFYYAMELLDGATLTQVILASGPMPAARVRHVLAAVCGALAEAHQLGLIHRDIKPENIMLCNQGGQMDVAKVLDFGLVKDIGPAEATDETAAHLTATNTITGTPLYMAPEAIKAPSSVGVASDVYALGAVGYFLLTGTHVFSGRSVIEICSQHLHEPPEPLGQRLGGEVPTELAQLLLDCLAKSAADRPASALQLLERLRACPVPHWTDDDAQRWWCTHKPKPSLDKEPKAASDQTIMIDLAQRSPSTRPQARS